MASNHRKHERQSTMSTYTVRHYRGRQIDGGSETATERGLTALGAYRAAVAAKTEPGCRLIGITRESDGLSVTVRQLRGWAKIGKH